MILVSCHSEGAFFATEESRIMGVEILRYAQNDMNEVFNILL